MYSNNKDQDAPKNSISYSRAIARQLSLQKKDLRKLLVGTKLTIDRFIHDDTSISNDDQFQIFRNAIRVSENPAFGLQLGNTLTPTAHGAMGFLAHSSPTLLSAIQDFGMYLPIRVGFGRLDLQPVDDFMECTLHVTYTQDPDVFRMISEAFAVSLLTLIEYALGYRLEDAKLFFNYQQPKYITLYHDNFNFPIKFNSTSNKLLLPLNLMNEINVSADFTAHEQSLKHCKRLFDDINHTDNNTSTRVRKLLLSTPNKIVNEGECAAELFISKRTLSRRLKSEDTSFREIREDVITSLSKGYLRETSLSIETIARLLNYHDASSFRRAFKRLLGVTPQEFRRQNQID